MRSLLSSLVLCVALSGCSTGEPCTVPELGSTFVVSSLALREVDGDRAAGFDLDGRESSGAGPACDDAVLDWRSDLDPSRGGIDNTMVDLVGPMRDMVTEHGDSPGPAGALAFDALIADGRLALLVEVVPDGVDGVRVRIHRGAPVEPLALDATGRIAGGQRFTVLDTVADLALEAPRTDDACRVRARMAAFAPTTADPTPFPPLDVARVTHVAFDLGEDGLANGRLGGTWSPDDAVLWAERLGLDDGQGVAIRDLLSLLVDMRSDTTSACDRLSFGLAFEGVPALLER